MRTKFVFIIQTTRSNATGYILQKHSNVGRIIKAKSS